MSKRFLSASATFLLCATALAQSESFTPLSQDEAVAFIKGKKLNSVRLAGGNPSIQFLDDGRMYGNNGGSSDSGKWELKDGKRCMSWRRWDYEGCGSLVKGSDSKIRHMYPTGDTVHLVFN